MGATETQWRLTLESWRLMLGAMKAHQKLQRLAIWLWRLTLLIVFI
jgi:hypothetical protein